MTASSKGIGTQNESSLHKSLKFQYAGPGETEKERGGYVCDAIGKAGEAIEIQTGNFGSLKKKLPALASYGKVRLIYPVIANKIIELYDINGNLVSRKKSPRKGKWWDIFNELIYAPSLINQKKVCFELVMIDVIERRLMDGKGSWRRKGISINDRLLEKRGETIVLKKKADWKRFVPIPANEEITVKTLAKTIHIRPVLARKTLYTLEKASLLEKIEKKNRSWIYRFK